MGCVPTGRDFNFAHSYVTMVADSFIGASESDRIAALETTSDEVIHIRQRQIAARADRT